MRVFCVGIATNENAFHPTPCSREFSPKSKRERDQHRMNALESIDITESGIRTAMRPVSAKARSPILSR
jgi:hypothetical protein